LEPKVRRNKAEPKAFSKSLRHFLSRPTGKIILGVCVFAFCAAIVAFSYNYMHYARLIDAKLQDGPFSNTSKLFADSEAVNVGDDSSPEEIAARIRRAGYGESRTNRMGWFRVKPDSIEIYPGGDSYFQEEAGLIRFQEGRVSQIISLRDNTERPAYLLEPELITNLFDSKREKRRIVHFQEIPPLIVNAVLSAEDKRFFQHAGFDPLRILKSAYVDIKSGRNAMGASTLSMQLARSLWLTTERTWRRKIPEIFITLHLERKLTKEQIFEHYANTIYIGQVSSFAVHGFGEGAQAYFGKDLRQLTLPEAALLAGLPQSPSRYNPFRNSQTATTRRNIILRMMRDNGYINEEQLQSALKAPLGVNTNGLRSDDAPYFVDLINEKLVEQFQDHDFQGNTYRVYTTLDTRLQQAAVQAMSEGLAEVDALLLKRGRTPAKGWPQVQAAMVVLNARTGEVKALVGGRDYGHSQLNRALAKRPPGSSFKPFVYAAVLRSTLEDSAHPITTTTTVVDEPTTFWYDEKPYEPNNFKSEFHGTVTLRQAITKSMNIPAIKFAEMVGYDHVVKMARDAGMNRDIKATPAVALGAYEVQPLEIAGAYTVFSNNGIYAPPRFIRVIRNQDGREIFTSKPRERQALDPRVSYMMVNLMEDVVRTGTGAGIRSRGFALPAAGKTGTSHDGWFAGFTSELICVVWVGYDDNRELGLEGSKSALPIWTSFMKKAHKFRPYRNARPFEAPDGIVTVAVDPPTGKLAGAGCSAPPKQEVFLAGTQPLEYCNGSSATQVSGWDASPAEEAPEQSGRVETQRVAARRVDSIPTPVQETPKPAPRPAEEKKGVLGRLLGIFK